MQPQIVQIARGTRMLDSPYATEFRNFWPTKERNEVVPLTPGENQSGGSILTTDPEEGTYVIVSDVQAGQVRRAVSFVKGVIAEEQGTLHAFPYLSFVKINDAEANALAEVSYSTGSNYRADAKFPAKPAGKQPSSASSQWLRAAYYSPLASRIRDKLTGIHLEAEARLAAYAAFEDALTLMESNEFDLIPDVKFSEEGLLFLKWERGRYGIILAFAGDQIVSLGIHRPGQLYMQNGIDVPVTEVLPDVFSEIITRVRS